MYTGAMQASQPSSKRSGKIRQLNVRWLDNDVEDIQTIAQTEQRCASEVVRFLVRHGINQYRAAGSFEAMRLTTNFDVFMNMVNRMTDAMLKASGAMRHVHGENFRPEVMEEELRKEIRSSAQLRVHQRKEVQHNRRQGDVKHGEQERRKA
jgi:hypothetical protein